MSTASHLGSRMTIRLIATGDDEQTQRAMAALEALPNTNIEVSYCPTTVADWFECPFVRDESGQEFFGLDGIEFFVAKRLRGAAS